MKLFRRYFSVLLCVLLLSIVFSLNASAEVVDSSKIKVNILAYDDTNRTYGQCDILNGEIGFGGKGNDFTTTSGTALQLRHRLTFVDTSGKPLFYKNKVYKFSVDNLWRTISVDGFTQTKNTYFYYARAYYSDNTSEDFTGSNYGSITSNSSGDTYSLIFNIEPKKDIVRLEYVLNIHLKATQSSVYLSTSFGGDPISITKDEQSEEAGLLGGLIGWVKNIFDKIGNIFDSIKEGFSNMGQGFVNIVNKLTDGFKNIVDSLLELPSKLWQLISDGLKALFVPDTEYITQYKEDWDSLLSSRFGAMYEVTDLLFNSFDNIVNMPVDIQYDIMFPNVSLRDVGIPFDFGGWRVRLFPEEFDFIQDIVKIVTTVACVLLFINGLRKRYDNVVG